LFTSTSNSRTEPPATCQRLAAADDIVTYLDGSYRRETIQHLARTGDQPFVGRG
jgi:hypothetical protein